MQIFNSANKKSYKEIDAVKNSIINKSLIIGSALGLLAFATSLEFNIQNNYQFFAILDFIVVASFIFISIIRKRLNIKIKSGIILLGIFILSLGSIYKVGVFADSKILLILIPVFAYLGYSFKHAIILFSIAIISFLAIGYLYINGIIQSNIILSHRAISISVWVNNTLLFVMATTLIIIILEKFGFIFLKLIQDLKDKNLLLEDYRANLELLIKQRTEELEATNDKLKATNNTLEITIEKLNSTQDSLIQQDKMASLGLLASGVAHEINNPLNFIQGGINGIEMYFDDNLDKHHIKKMSMFIDGVKEGVARASNIVTSLSRFSVSDNAITEKCDMHNIIDNCLTMMNCSIKCGVEIQKNYSDLPIKIKCNEGELHQVILNIISNAEQSIEADGVIEVTTKVDEQKVTILVKDNGCGIKEDIISKISDPFFTTKDTGKGAGLGLSIAHKIIKDHGGTIDYISEIGIGTDVIISLPINY